MQSFAHPSASNESVAVATVAATVAAVQKETVVVATVADVEVVRNPLGTLDTLQWFWNWKVA